MDNHLKMKKALVFLCLFPLWPAYLAVFIGLGLRRCVSYMDTGTWDTPRS